MRRITLTLAVAALVVLAGCTGISSHLGNAPDAGSTGSGSGDNSNGDGSNDASDASEDDAFTPFAFQHSGTYTYETYDEEDGTGKLVWDIRSIDGENITMRSSFTNQGETQSKTATFTREEALVQLAFMPGGQYLMTTMFSPSANGIYGNDFRVGNTWTAPSSQGTMTYEITKQRTIAEISCYDAEIRINGSVFTDACYSPDHGTAMYGVIYDEDGTKVREMKLIAYERK
ncbi:hypothetical protein NKF26_16360 [Haladaptatus sp. AB618]|uniref:hypothetical protein n=1 Tax=Haladaptatus sp. AB618 TaxID=2934173 RepID=UPI00209BFBB2|nr:hypothetical protein [Haladaptatus sp. AB618]MCO8255381.1 hypothetical protein [Haladaptatus sp. AB618]